MNGDESRLQHDSYAGCTRSALYVLSRFFLLASVVLSFFKPVVKAEYFLCCVFLRIHYRCVLYFACSVVVLFLDESSSAAFKRSVLRLQQRSIEKLFYADIISSYG